MSKAASQTVTDSGLGIEFLDFPSEQAQAESLRIIRERIARRERIEATRVGCSAWYVMTRGSLSR